MINAGTVINKMTEYYAGDKKRIAHFIKVYGYAKAICECENIDKQTEHIIEIAAITHDIGIKVSEAKYGNCNGKHQEEEGPPIAESLLKDLNEDKDVIDRVKYIIARHHTYGEDFGIDHQIIIEADFLVNADEDCMGKEKIRSVKERIFKTKSGQQILYNIYGV